MMPLIEILIIAAFIIDMFLTYNYLKTYKEIRPKADWTLAEANPLLRACLRDLGLKPGIIVGGIFISLILSLIIFIVNENWKYFLLGLYFMVNTFHLVNWNALKRLKLIELKGG